MIGTAVFVVVFVGLGLTVVFAAMRSGRRPPQPGQRESRSVRRAWAVALATVIGFIGLLVPALVLVANGDNHAKHGPGGIKLTDAQANGRVLFARNCATCHTLRGSDAVGRMGPNLDTLNGGNLQAAFVLNAIQQGRANGRGQMPAGLLEGQQAKNVAAYVSAVAGR